MIWVALHESVKVTSNDTANIRQWEKQHLKFMQGRQPLEERGKKKHIFLWLSRWKGSQAFKTVSFLPIQSLSSGNLQRFTPSDTKSMTYFNIKNAFFKLAFCVQILSVSVSTQSKSCVFSRNLTGIKKLYYD